MVTVEPITPGWAHALAAGDKVFEQRFGVPVVAGWAPFPEVIPFMVDAAASESPEWGPHLVFDDDGALVGNAGWKGAPVDGTAELGYAVAPDRRGKGIATTTVRLLIARGHTAGVRLVRAHTLAAESASTSVLRRCGFAWAGEFVDPEDGPVWRWEFVVDP